MPINLSTSKPLIVLIVLTCLLSACTRTKLAYGMLDNWLRWTVDDYFDPSPAQKEQIKALSKAFHRWHRHNELIPLAQFTEQVAQTLAQPSITLAQVTDLTDQTEKMFRRSAQQLQQVSGGLLGSLSATQIEQINQQLITDQREYQQQYLALSSHERIADRAQATAKFFARPMGKLTKAQHKLIADWSASVEDLAAESLLQQLVWRQQFNQKVRADLSLEGNLSALSQWLFQPLAPLTPDHQQREQANRQRIGQLVVDLHSTMTDRQRLRVQQRLARYQQDFLELAEGVATAAPESTSPAPVKTNLPENPLAGAAVN